MIKINGKASPEALNLTVSAYLSAFGYEPLRVAIEYNNCILKKCDYDTTTIKDGDTLEIVSFVGGG